MMRRPGVFVCLPTKSTERPSPVRLKFNFIITEKDAVRMKVAGEGPRFSHRLFH